MSSDHVATGDQGDFTGPTLAGSISWAPEITTFTAIGIATAITGNILISLALNLQKLAHSRVEAEHLAKIQNRPERPDKSRRNRAQPSLDERQEDENEDCSEMFSSSSTVRPGPGQGLYSAANGDSAPGQATPSAQQEDQGQHYIAFPVVADATQEEGYGSTAGANCTAESRPVTPLWRRFITPSKWRVTGSKSEVTETSQLLPVEIVTESEALRPRLKVNGDSERSSCLEDDDDFNETAYLQTKLWWLGFALMNIGEAGNFISYGFAPASIVAPLGTFALIANCFFAPLMLGERFRMRDLVGIMVAILGAVTVVLASNSSDTRYNPEELIKAISKHSFIIYSIVYIVSGIVLSGLSHGSFGRRYVFVDVGLCALFGGFTALSTKAFSSLLTLEGPKVFTFWITYPIIAVLAGTGVGQIRYLNRALMRFDSKLVIPSQFVLFNLSVIVGSAILYGDFKKAHFHQMITFLYGCAATFAGVFIIASSASSSSSTDDSDVEGDARSIRSEPRNVVGSISRRRHAALVIPDGVEPTPILRHKRSSITMMGLSPAQHLLLVHTPPRDTHMDLSDLEYDVPSTPESMRRRGAPSRPRTERWESVPSIASVTQQGS